jgi:hypothetical protein
MTSLSQTAAAKKARREYQERQKARTVPRWGTKLPITGNNPDPDARAKARIREESRKRVEAKKRAAKLRNKKK